MNSTVEILFCGSGNQTTVNYWQYLTLVNAGDERLRTAKVRFGGGRKTTKKAA